MAVLELGCGDARVLRGLASSSAEERQQSSSSSSPPSREAGELDSAELVGMDHEAQFLDRCGSLPGGDDVLAVLGDMCSFTLNRTFDSIIMPSSTLLCLESEEQVLQCFESVRRHLGSRGEFLLDAYNVDEILEEDWSWDHAKDSFDSEYGNLVKSFPDEDAFEMSKHDAEKQVFTCRYTHLPKPLATEDTSGSAARPPSVSYELTHRYLKSQQLRRLAKAADLYVRSIEGGFKGEEFTSDSPRMVVSCMLASEAPDELVPEGWRAIDWEDMDNEWENPEFDDLDDNGEEDEQPYSGAASGDSFR